MTLQRVFNAQSVAIIGASQDEKKRGFQAIKTLIDEKYEGEIYPVNPHEEFILGLRCYKSVLNIEKDVDLALITTPAETVPSILKDCGRKGIAGAVIIAGGFAELGGQGKDLENRIVKVAGQYNIRLIGPNTSGMINVKKNLNLVGLKDVPKGDIALLTQSGNIALHLITEAKLKSQKGFSYYVGVGNEADIKFHEYLELFESDPGTKAILMYVEGLRDGRKFLQQAYKTTTKKPIILLKSGRSSAGSQSAGSHTGALAGISEVAQTAFELAGIITIENPDELFPAAETLSSLPPIYNNRVAILADGGGHATIAADLLTDHGVEIPVLSKKTQARLKEILPPNASVQNPIDIAGGADSNPDVFADCAKIISEDKRIGGLLIVGLFGGYGIRFSEKLKFIEEDAAHRMGKLLKKTEKPIILHSLYNFAQPHSLELLRYYGIPVYDSLDIACRCIAVLCQYGHKIAMPHRKASFIFNWGAKAKKKGEEIIRTAQKEGRNILLEQEAKELLKLHGAPVSLDRLAKNADEAVKIADDLGGEVVLKIVSPDILHKSDAGGVKLNLKTKAEIKKAFDKIIENAGSYNKEADIRGCIVSRMAGEGIEVIIGTKIDEQFGPVIMFGVGGILVEVLKDISFRVLPISRTAPAEMMSDIKSYSILNGVRGKPPVDKEALSSLLLTVSEIIESYPQIQEMDLNPVIAHEDGVTIVDARIILKNPS
ncbi:MAG: acetate--CoA ligase family protein [Proteobacteria bacterium]|nr:acetate--CoA ligase family protein [Pseudomonadota bacterium]